MARDFDDVDDRIDFGSSAVLDDLGAITVAFWARFDAPDARYDVAISKGQGGSGESGWGVGYSTFGTPPGRAATWYRTYSSANGEWSTPVGSFAQNAQHQVVIAHDGTTGPPTMYRDGAAQTVTQSKAPSGTLTSDAAKSLVLGEDAAGGSDLDGQLAEVAIWDVALTAGEAATLGKGFCPLLVRPQSLVLYAPLVGAYSPETDLVGGGTGATTGTTKVAHPRVMRPVSGRSP